MSYRQTEHPAVLIANERKARLALANCVSAAGTILGLPTAGR